MVQKTCSLQDSGASEQKNNMRIISASELEGIISQRAVHSIRNVKNHFSVYIYPVECIFSTIAPPQICRSMIKFSMMETRYER